MIIVQPVHTSGIMGVAQDEPGIGRRNGMQLKRILNRVESHSGFLYGAVRWNEKAERPVLDSEIRARMCQGV